MVVACVALFVASAGTSIAASHYLITSTKQIKPSVLKQLKGARGPTGQSVIGDIGPEGPKGDTGTTGAIGFPGAKGDTGAAGPAGAKGDTGLTGTTGPAGPTGPIGPQGLKGDTGLAGDAGAAGKTVLNGSGIPAAGLGVDGDFYIDTTANVVYGPKTGGAWVSPTSMIGPQGLKGDTGSQGLKGDTGTRGPAGTEGAAEASVTTYETTSTAGAGWVDLATPGPSVTVTVPASGKVLVTLTAAIISTAANEEVAMGFCIDGVQADLWHSLAYMGQTAAVMTQNSATFVESVTPGSHTFKATYVAAGGYGIFWNRHIIVIPLP